MDSKEARFARIRQLIGRQNLERLRHTRVMVAGLGAVGSYAVEGLARSGVGHIRVVDFDVINYSNINRQLYALESTLGRSKAEIARERILDINPSCNVEALSCFIDQISVARLLTPTPDILIDAIDSLNSKVELLASGVNAGVGIVLSSMGAASRTDPSQIRVDDIKCTHSCPLARLVRKRLKRRGVDGGIRCVYSIEPVQTHSADSGPEDTCQEVNTQTRGRPRTPLGSFSCLTGIFGLTLAREAIMAVVDDNRGVTRCQPSSG